MRPLLFLLKLIVQLRDYLVDIASLHLTTPTGKPVGFLLPSLACNRTPYEYFHRFWNTGISLFE